MTDSDAATEALVTIWCGSPDPAVTDWRVNVDTLAQVADIVGAGIGMVSVADEARNTTIFLPARNVTRMEVRDA